MLSSSSPTRIKIQSLLTDSNLGNKFNSDYRKYSRNYENSFFSEEYNFGAEYQTNVIFSPKSYIPRILSSNVTVNIFGESINFFELAVQLEGIEYYTEKIFGPDGPLSNMKVAIYLQHLLRMIRSTQNENNYWSKIKTLPNVINNNFIHPRICLSYKVFGNEIKFIILDGDRNIYSTLMNLNPWEKIKKILSQGETFHFENYAMFLDLSYGIPTVAGLPLRLDLSGSLACNIKISGIMSSEDFFSNGEMQLNGNIAPG